MQPLDGIKVLDLSRLAPGPFCTMILGDLGADVLMIEAPPGATSEIHRPWAEADTGREDAFDPLRRNKRSLVLNLKEARGREILHQLVRESDVLVEGFRPGVIERLGCDYETLARINPRIVLCSVSGYGQTGPYVDQVGHDINYISIGGMLGFVGWPDSPPAIPGNIVADFAGGGMHAAMAILAALVGRQATGRGQHVDIAMSDGVLYLLATWAKQVLAGGDPPKRGEYFLNGQLPLYNVYECKDGGWISVGSIETKFWRNLCQAMDAEQYVERAFDPSAFDEIKAHFKAQFKTKTRTEWMEILSKVEICAAPVYDLREALDDPHNRARGMVVEVEHPQYGPVRQVGIGPKFSETPGQVRSLSPRLGEQTDAVLAGLGYSADDIAALRADRIVA
ncbi:MAG TPA: CaiB/BaiF CoA-transferase family protein [bacterium]|nr:CaiB/BaiF CoA-transferase family protein [bacterium]